MNLDPISLIGILLCGYGIFSFLSMRESNAEHGVPFLSLGLAILYLSGALLPGAQIETQAKMDHSAFMRTADYYLSLEPKVVELEKRVVQKEHEVEQLNSENHEQRQRISDLEALKIGVKPSIWRDFGILCMGAIIAVSGMYSWQRRTHTTTKDE